MSGIIRHIGLWILAAGFSWATVILAAGPLRALRSSSPYWVFWPVVCLIATGFWFASPWLASAKLAGLGFLAVALVVGLFTEVERLGISRGTAAGVSVAALVAAVGVGFGAWCREMKIGPLTWLSQWVEGALAKVKDVNPSLVFDSEQIVAQLPSALVILGLMVIAIAVVSEGTWVRFLGSSVDQKLGRAWTDFRLADFLIYVLMAVLLASFTQHGVKWLSTAGINGLNILVVLYFFQGMAVVFKACDHFAVGPFWRVFLGFVLTFQLALMVAVIGVADFWLDFRNRLNRPPMHSKTET